MKDPDFVLTNLALANDWLRTQPSKSMRECAETCRDAIDYINRLEKEVDRALDKRAMELGWGEAIEYARKRMGELEDENTLLRASLVQISTLRGLGIVRCIEIAENALNPNTATQDTTDRRVG